MKEVLYIQAGAFANYIGTHFWNTQEGYFTYDEGEDSAEPDVVHDISFREGLTSKGEATFCPRLLLFDRKANFGARSGGLYGEDDAASELEQTTSLWNGSVVEYRQDPISQSAYHDQLDKDAVKAGEEDGSMHDYDEDTHPPPKDVRFWSDYNRVFFHPRSMQPLPDLAEWESAEGDWSGNKDAFIRYDQEHALMDDSFRIFVEECDALQGVQVMHDTATFGGFTDSFLGAFRDEFPKLTCLAFPLLSNAVPGAIDTDDTLAMCKALNDALCLRSLDELSSLNVPLQAPSTWVTGKWLDGLDLNRGSIYHTSALLSAHIESATLPFRLKRSIDDLAGVCGALGAGGQMRFAHLSGVFPLGVPLTPDHDFRTRVHDFSALGENKLESVPAYAKIYVSRGFAGPDIKSFQSWAESYRPTPYIVHAPAYPVPTSFPLRVPRRPLPASTPAATRQHQRTARALSALASTPATAQLFSAHAALAANVARRHADVALRLGVEPDEMREVADALWALADGYAGEGMGTDDDEVGEDE